MGIRIRHARPFCSTCNFPIRTSERGGECESCRTFYSTDQIRKAFQQFLSDEEKKDSDRHIKVNHAVDLENRDDDLSIVNVTEEGLPMWKKFISYFGLPVEERDYETSIFPLVSILFCVSCLLIYYFGEFLLTKFILIPGELQRMGGLNFFTYSLIHASALHLFGNLIFLWPFMDNVEEHLGPLKTFILIVASAVGSGLLHMTFSKSGLPLAGASGVCFALATFYCLKYPKNRFLISIPLVGMLFFSYRLRLKARTLFFFYILLELISLKKQVQGLTRVSHLGHVGGALVGLIFYYFFADSEEPQNMASRIERPRT